MTRHLRSPRVLGWTVTVVLALGAFAQSDYQIGAALLTLGGCLAVIALFEAMVKS